MTDQCTWFAVVVPLRNCFVNQYREYGHSPDNRLLRVDLESETHKYAVVLKAGKALRTKADNVAADTQGQVITVTGKYMFNLSDLDISTL